MSALSITANNVARGTDAQTATYTAGGTLTAGMLVYLDTTDRDSSGNPKAKAADADAGTDLAATIAGVALNAAVSGQPVTIQYAGSYTHGGTSVLALVYILGGGTAGDINPSADLTTNWRCSVWGVATSTTVIKIGIINSGAIKA